MKATLRTILLTVVATTLAWCVVIVAFLSWAASDQSSDNRLRMQFLAQPGSLGLIEFHNSKDRAVVISIERHSAAEGGNQSAIARELVASKASLRIALREIDK